MQTKHKYKKKTLADYIAENTLNREFSACRPSEKAYMSAILDLHGRNIVSFSVSRKNDTALVLDIFEQAFLQCYDDRSLVHSDGVRTIPATLSVREKRNRKSLVE